MDSAHEASVPVLVRTSARIRWNQSICRFAAARNFSVRGRMHSRASETVGILRIQLFLLVRTTVLEPASRPAHPRHRAHGVAILIGLTMLAARRRSRPPPARMHPLVSPGPRRSARAQCAGHDPLSNAFGGPSQASARRRPAPSDDGGRSCSARVCPDDAALEALTELSGCAGGSPLAGLSAPQHGGRAPAGS